MLFFQTSSFKFGLLADDFANNSAHKYFKLAQQSAKSTRPFQAWNYFLKCLWIDLIILYYVYCNHIGNNSLVISSLFKIFPLDVIFWQCKELLWAFL